MPTAVGLQSVLRVHQKEISLAPSVLAPYAGRYELATGQTMTVTIDGGQLKIQPTGGNAMTFLAESETRFFVREVSFVVESCATERATSRSSSSIRALARTA